MTVVSIRTNNPGAMWPGAIATKWDSTSFETLKDGNKAAIFPDKVRGAAAEFDLWRSRYAGLTFSAAIEKWSGGNSSTEYVDFVQKRTGIKLADRITAEMLAGPVGLAFMKAQARWEAGIDYPLSDEEWRRAQQMVFGEQSPPAAKPQAAAPSAPAAAAPVAPGYKLTWLPGVLRARGLEVVEHPGWQTRGHGDVGVIQGVLCHHTCGPLHGDLPDENVLVEGRSDLAGPLCNIGLGRSGRVTMVAAGKGYHAGRGFWRGITDGNAHMIGIEAENTGEKTGPRADPWPEVQLEAYAKVCAAILDHVGAPVTMAAGHKEYALPKGRKDDPDFDMDEFRERVSKHMGQPTQSPVSPTARRGRTIVVDLNVRAAASAASRVVDVLPDSGHEVTVLDEAMNGNTKWYRIGDGEWVSSAYVALA